MAFVDDVDADYAKHMAAAKFSTLETISKVAVIGLPFAGESTTKQYAQVGNAVPVQLARALLSFGSSSHQECSASSRDRRARQAAF